MQKWCFSILLLLALVPHLSAQEEEPDDVEPNRPVNISVEVDTLRRVPLVGPNRRWFTHSTCGLYTRFGPQETGAATLGRSVLFDYGFRTKLKLWKWDALCLDLNIGQERWSLKQDSLKILPDTITHRYERFQFNRLQATFCNRINLNRHRGNVVGTYIDFGVYGNWMYHNVHITKDSLNATGNSGPKTFKSRETKLPYVNPIQYGYTARFGSEYFSLSATWRVSDYFWKSENQGYPELPRLCFGILLSTY